MKGMNIQKMKSLLVLALAGVIVFSSCGPSTTITGSWKDPELKGNDGSAKSVFIAALTGNMSVRTKLEADMAAQAEKRGFKAMKSTDYFPQTFTKENAPNKDQLLGKIKSLGADGILTIALVDKQNETRYVPGTTTYSPYMYGGYRGFGGYYGAMYPTMYDPGYYTTDKSYFLETNLYRTSDEKLVWSAQSKTINPNGLDDFSKGYIEALGKRMQADGLIAK